MPGLRTVRVLPLAGLLIACVTPGTTPPPAMAIPTESASAGATAALARYAVVRLTADVSGLSADERRMIPILIEAARPMDDVYWMQVIGPHDSVLAGITDPALRRYTEINYGPWDRLANDTPFIAGVGPKPAGANLYPRDITADEFQRVVAAAPKARADSLKSLYTLVRRDASGALVAIDYHRAYPAQTALAARKLREAAPLAEDPGLRRYLELRASALESDDYRASDMAWLDMKSNRIDVVIGPIETYEDALFGYKAAHEAYVLIKDMQWSQRLSRYATLLPGLQEGLPVAAELKRERPGTDSDLNAYDAVFYAGQANAGAKTIAINLPNDEEVQLAKGTRRLQLKNVMRAKFDRILLPIANELIAPEQRRYVAFDAFFENVMFHEVAHGLGIKNTINGRGTVRTALKEQASALEEGKADILGLYLVTTLSDRGELSGNDLMNNYVTFLAGIFRSVRFGATSAHGRANMLQFHFFQSRGAFARDAATGTYRVDRERMRAAMAELAERILRLQGTGDYDAVKQQLAETGRIPAELQGDLARLTTKAIPVDLIFEQGASVLGLP